MTAQTKTILRDVGLVLHVPAAMALLSLFICFAFAETFAVGPFLLTAAAAFALGQALYWSCRSREPTLLHHGMMIAALSWLFVPFLGALPFWLTATLAGPGAGPGAVDFQDPLNALFEAFSGYTGTGLTMAQHPSLLPHALQWWRTFMEWVGGVGVIVLMLSILKPTAGAFRLYYSEGRDEKILPTVTSTVRAIWWIYLSFTALSVLLLKGAGMSWWEALNHGMTGIATGGFGITDHSIADFGPGVRMSLLPIMMIGAISFATLYQALVQGQGRWRLLWQDEQLRWLWGLALAGTTALWLENGWFSGAWVGLDSAFQWISALSTAGFQTADLTGWSPTAQLLLSLAMLLGGAAGSTAGGVKVLRIVLLHRGLVWRFRRLGLSPHQLMRYDLNGRVLAEREAYQLVESAGVLAALWAVSLWAGILILVHVMQEGFTLSEAILEVASALGNVGLSTGITGPHLHPLGKAVLMVCMWVGRLEIIPVLILCSVGCGGLARWLKSRVPRPGG